MRRAGSAGALARTACASTLRLRHPLDFFALRSVRTRASALPANRGLVDRNLLPLNDPVLADCRRETKAGQLATERLRFPVLQISNFEGETMIRRIALAITLTAVPFISSPPLTHNAAAPPHDAITI